MAACTANTIICLSSPAGLQSQTPRRLARPRLAPTGKRSRPAFHLVVHTAPNTRNKKGELAGYWKTLAEDFHWHIEILPILEKRSKSYSIKEVYFNVSAPGASRRTIAFAGSQFMSLRLRQRNLRTQTGGILSSLISLLFVVVLCAVLYFARGPILRFAGETWVVEDPLDRADAIIVLSDDNFYADRATRGADLYRHGMGSNRSRQWPQVAPIRGHRAS